MILPLAFYTRTNVLEVARDLLGKVLVTEMEGQRTSGIIVETEAYAGITDRASHAFGGRHTQRTQVMYRQGGVAYVYLCYGIHHLFNVVTHNAGTPHAVLIRAVEPLGGIDIMLARRGKTRLQPSVTSGPGALSAALGITTRLTGASLMGPGIWIEDGPQIIADSAIVATPRVGVGYAAEDALLPYRFVVKGNAYVSKPRP